MSMAKPTEHEKLRIVFVAADPRTMDKVDLGREVRRIQERIRASDHRDAIDFRARWAVRPRDLQEILLADKPHVVHFSVRATSEAQIVLEDEDGNAAPVSKAALADLFRILKDNIRVVVLNASPTAPQAEAITEHIDAAVGIEGATSDEATSAFSASFYRAIGYGRSLKDAFELGKIAIEMERLSGNDGYRLLVKRGVDPREMILINAPLPAANPPREEAIAAAPEPPKEPRHALRLGRRALAALASLAFILALAWLLYPWLKPLPLASFQREARGIALGGPWLASDQGRAFCKQLKAFDGGQAVGCLPFARGAWNESRFQKNAERANAVVAAVIDESGAARVFPLSPIEPDALIGKEVLLDMTREGDWPQIAPVLRALSFKWAPDPDVVDSRLSCPPLGSGAIRLSELLALYLIDACREQPMDPKRLLDVCGAAGAGVSCSLAHYLYVEYFKRLPDVRVELDTMLKDEDARVRGVGRLKLARLDCKEGALAASTEAVLTLDSEDRSCSRSSLPEIAACIRAKAKGPVDPRIDEIETRLLSSGDPCPNAVRARNLGRRAYFRGLGGRWEQAEEDYKSAYHLSHDPGYALGLVEAKLHQGHAKEAADALRDLKVPFEGSNRFYAALLRWIAAPREEKEATADALVSAHESLDLNVPALPVDLDKDLRELTCSSPSSGECAYDVLANPKTPRSTEKLRRSLGGGG